MNQEQFNLIVKIIKSGAPVLADELCEALVNLVNAYNEKCAEIKNLTSEPDKENEKTEG